MGSSSYDLLLARFASLLLMSGADLFGLVVSVLLVGYLFYALIHGERL